MSALCLSDCGDLGVQKPWRELPHDFVPVTECVTGAFSPPAPAPAPSGDPLAARGFLRTATTAAFARLIMREVRHRRRMARNVSGVSIYVLADKAGYNNLYVFYWESGRRTPTLRQALECLCAITLLTEPAARAA